MIKIIGVHPAVFGNPNGVREYLKDFGTEKGRWIPLIPSNWRSIVSQSLKRSNLGPVKKNEMRDRINNPRFSDRYLKIDDSELTEAQWNEAMTRLLDRGLCDAAIVPSGENLGAKTLVAHEFDPDCELYAVDTSGFLVREPLELARKVVPALRFAKELHVIDVYCMSVGTNSASYGRFFGEILKWCRVNNPGIKTLSLHRRAPDNYDQFREKSNYSSWIKSNLEHGEMFRVNYLKEHPDGDRIHLRAVFTDRVLITGHYGFGEGPNEVTTTDLVIRKHVDLLTVRDLYLPDKNQGFTLIDTIEIVG